MVNENKGGQSIMTDEAREARNRYAREWRSRNKEKVKETMQRYWEKKAKAGTEKSELVRNIRNGTKLDIRED